MNNSFKTLTYTSDETDQAIIEAEKKALIRDENNIAYFIQGLTSEEIVMPRINESEKIVRRRILFRNLSLRKANLLVQYIYLDNDERNRFIKSKYEYLIEQVQYNGEKQIEANFRNIRLGLYL